MLSWACDPVQGHELPTISDTSLIVTKAEPSASLMMRRIVDSSTRVTTQYSTLFAPEMRPSPSTLVSRKTAWRQMRVDQKMTQGEQNLLLLESLIPRGERFYVWCYKKDGSFVDTSCPQEEREVLRQAFHILGGMEKTIRAAGDHSQTWPLIIGSPIGMQWAVTFEAERKRELIFVIGPVFYSAPLESQLRVALRPYMNSTKNAAWASNLYKLLPTLPVMSYAIFTRYVMMVHNTLTGEQMGMDALSSALPQEAGTVPAHAEQRDRNSVYLAERALLHMVRNGDISYQSVLQNSSGLSPGVPIQGQDPLRQMKTSIVVFTTLVSRAAIEGGLSPEIAYPLGDSYIQSAENCRDSGELNALAHAMYHDFIYRVHHLRANPSSLTALAAVISLERPQTAMQGWL